MLAAFIALGAAAYAQTPADPSYRLGSNDRIQVGVLEDDSLNLERIVSPNGTITLPLIGEIVVGGRTAEEVRLRIKRALEKDFLRLATVDVEIIDARSQPITVLGAVNQPGTVYLGGVRTLSQALSAAGGITEANLGIVEIRREADNGLSDQLEISLRELLRRGDTSLDVPLFARDVINVPMASDITVYFLGEISSQGALVIKGTERASLLTAIARAGGLTDRAASKLTIRRNSDGPNPIEIIANYKKILAGTSPDIDLQDGDLIVVKEAFL